MIFGVMMEFLLQCGFLANQQKFYFLKKHIKNLVKSLKAYKLYKPSIEKKILKLIKLNILLNRSYNHLLRVAINNKMISISLRERKTPNIKI